MHNRARVERNARRTGLVNAKRFVRREEQQRRVNDITWVRVVGRKTAEQGEGHDGKPTGWRTGQEAEQDGCHRKRSKAEWNARAGAGNGMSRQGRTGQDRAT